MGLGSSWEQLRWERLGQAYFLNALPSILLMAMLKARV